MKRFIYKAPLDITFYIFNPFKTNLPVIKISYHVYQKMSCKNKFNIIYLETKKLSCFLFITYITDIKTTTFIDGLLHLVTTIK